jgi:translation initiation factor 2 beta subunit (eIF-2beta)/eIF-5
MFASITGACALFGGVVQVSDNLNSNRLESARSKSLTTIAQHTLSETCRRSDGGQFFKNQVIQDDSQVLTPTSCYKNELGEKAYVAYEGGRLVIKEVFSAKEVKSKMSQLTKGEKND